LEERVVFLKRDFYLNPVFILGLLVLSGSAYSMLRSTGVSDHIDQGGSELVAGLKEALSVGTREAVRLVSDVDGYFGHEIIKIIMPDEMKSLADTLGSVGFQKQVDEFVLSMNRAAEKAAPAALDIFVAAVKAMTFEDAADILGGGETAATEYFKEKTSEKIYEAFKPTVASSMQEVGVTQAYQQLSDKYSSLPFVKDIAVDLDDYVTRKALDGLFYMVGEEEKKIRTDPAARATDLLKKVFK
jgi:hypothetical protein